MAKKAYHVVLKPEGGWSVKSTGASRASRSFIKKNEAVGYARTIAKDGHFELFIHAKDGKIQQHDTYGSDPCPPRNCKK